MTCPDLHYCRQSPTYNLKGNIWKHKNHVPYQFMDSQVTNINTQTYKTELQNEGIKGIFPSIVDKAMWWSYTLDVNIVSNNRLPVFPWE